MKTIYITKEQINKIKDFELLSENKVQSAQDQVKNKVNAGVMDAVTACGTMEEGAEPESDKYELGVEKGVAISPNYHVNEEKEEKSFKKYFKEIAEFMEKSGLEVSPFPKVNLDWSEQDGLFIRTGFYSPEEREITIFCKDRHPKDILRTFSHEMIHHSQNLRGINLSFTSNDDVKDNKELEKIEAEAYLKGNIYFRKWTEYENTEKQPLNESALDVEYHYTTIENLRSILVSWDFVLRDSYSDSQSRKRAYFMSLSRIRSCKEGYGLLMNRRERPVVRIELNGRALNNIRDVNISSFDYWYDFVETPGRQIGGKNAEAEDSLTTYNKVIPDIFDNIVNRIDILFCPFYSYNQYKTACEFLNWAQTHYDCYKEFENKLHFYFNENNFNYQKNDDFNLKDLNNPKYRNYILNEIGLSETVWDFYGEENGLLCFENIDDLNDIDKYERKHLVKINLSKLKIREKSLNFRNKKRLISFLVKNGYEGVFDKTGDFLTLLCKNEYFNNGIIQDFEPNLQQPNINENSEKKSLNKPKTILNDEGEVVPDKCTCDGKIGTYICGEPIYKCTKCGKYYGTVKFGLDESRIFDETNPDDVDLSSFNIKRELNPKFWKNNLLDSRIRLKLLDIAEDFIDFLGVDWVEPDDIIMTGSLANFNWSKKYSDIDLHVLMDFSKVDKRTDFVKKYFDSLKNQWNEEHEDLKIFGFPVEVYVQDTNEEHASSGVYSLDKNEWLTEPKREKLAKAKVNKSLIRSKVAKYIDYIDELYDKYKKCSNDEYKIEKISKAANKLWDAIKNERKSELNNGKSEISNGNIVFKCLRRLNYLDKLYNLKMQTYDNLNSLR